MVAEPGLADGELAALGELEEFPPEVCP